MDELKSKLRKAYLNRASCEETMRTFKPDSQSYADWSEAVAEWDMEILRLADEIEEMERVLGCT